MHLTIYKNQIILFPLVLVFGFYLADKTGGITVLSIPLLIINTILAVLMVIFLYFYISRGNNTRKILIIIFLIALSIFFIIGFLRNNQQIRVSDFNKRYIDTVSAACGKGQIYLTGRIDSQPYLRYGKIEFLLYLEEIKCKNKSQDETIFSLYKDPKVLKVSGNPVAGRLEKDMFVRLQGRFKGDSTSPEGASFDAVEIKTFKKEGLKGYLYGFRSDTYRCIDNTLKDSLGNRFYGLASALILGDRDNMGFESKNRYVASGLYHILAISGLHISIFASIVSGIIQFRKKCCLSVIITIFFITAYVLLIGVKPSLIRASVMFSLVLIQSNLKKEYSRQYMTSITFCMMLLVFPKFFYEIGFWLSFIAVFSLFFILPILEKMIKDFGTFNKRFLGNIFVQIILATISINLLLWPVLSYSFGYIQVFSIISNTLVLPVFPLLMSFLFTGGLVSIFSHFMGSLIFRSSIPLLYLVETVSRIVGGLRYSIVEYKLTKPSMVFYYLFILAVFTAAKIMLKNRQNKV